MIATVLAVIALTQSPQPLALLVSAGRLEGPRLSPFRLEGPENDVRLMAHMLHARFGVPKERILILGLRNGEIGGGYAYLGDRATAEKIAREFALTVGNPERSASHRIFYFSGHGSRVDGREMLVGVDGGVLMDWKLRMLSARVRGQKLSYVFDCCHAAGGAKGPIQVQFGWPRRVLSEFLQPPPAAPKGNDPDGPQEPDSPNHTLYAASEREDPALEVAVATPGGPIMRMGLFTLTLYQVAMNCTGPLQAGDLIERVDRRIRQLDFGQYPRLLTRGPRTADAFGSSQSEVVAAEGRIDVGYLAGIQTNSRLRVGPRTAVVKLASPFTSVVSEPFSGPIHFVSRPNLGSVQFYKPGSRGKGDDDVIYQFNLNEKTQQVDVMMPSGVSTPLTPEVSTDLASLKEAMKLRGAAANLDSLDSPRGLKMTGTWAAFGDLDFRPSGTMGEQITVKLRTKEPSWLALFSLEPDGTIAWHYPNVSDSPQLSTAQDVVLCITPPDGQSLLVALASPHPISIPQGYFGDFRSKSPLVPTKKAPAFFSHLLDGLADSDGQLTRGGFDSTTVMLRAEFPH